MCERSEITIAFVFDAILNDYGREICKGALRAAKETGISIVFFGAGALEKKLSYNVMRNRLYSMINTDFFNGIVFMSSSLSNYIGEKELLKYIKKFCNIPIAHIGIHTSQDFCVNIDNASGMEEVTNHLIEVHKRKHIAFIGGTKGVKDAEERFTAYQKSLELHQIPYDENYVYEGHFNREDGTKAIHVFLDERKLDIDAVIGANDYMALYAMIELQRRGYQIPTQISIGGFDDLASARRHRLPLTTVRQPANSLGFTAIFEFVKQLEKDDKKAQNICWPAQMVIRQSCGCCELKHELQNNSVEAENYNNLLLNERDEIETILHRMLGGIIGTFEENEIKKSLDKELSKFGINEFELSFYEDQEYAVPYYSTRGTAYNRFLSKNLVEGTILSYHRPFQKFVMPLYYRKEDIGFFISDAGSKDISVLEVMRDQLSGALKGARLLEAAKQYSESLERKGEERTRDLGEALKHVKIASEKLEKLSIIDELTGLYNRRGFMTVARQQVELAKRNNKNILLLFLDLDGLKYINNTFGHTCGDVAIKAIAQIITKTFRQTDIIARLGDDEFTILAIDCSIIEYNIILGRAEDILKEWSQNSLWEFHLAFSCEAAPSKCQDCFSLEKLMEEADAELYKIKKGKKDKSAH